MDSSKVFGVLILCGLVALAVCIKHREVFRGKGVPVAFFTYLILTAIPFVVICVVWFAIGLIIR